MHNISLPSKSSFVSGSYPNHERNGDGGEWETDVVDALRDFRYVLHTQLERCPARLNADWFDFHVLLDTYIIYVVHQIARED